WWQFRIGTTAGILLGSHRRESAHAGFVRRQFGAPENRTLLETESIALRRPFERQLDAVEQRLGVELRGLLPLPDRFHDCRCYERQARETLDVALGNTFVSCDLGERVHPAGHQFVKPHPRTRYGFEQCRVYFARWFVTRGNDDPCFHTAALHFEWRSGVPEATLRPSLIEQLNQTITGLCEVGVRRPAPHHRYDS